jgi:hypothetical protein
MQLRCKVCAAVQPVTTADEADEDPRTASIRRGFRAEHVARCGEGAVSLQIGAPAADPIDLEAWNAYVASRNPPADVTLGADGLYSRTIMRDGVAQSVRVCEDCWQTIPRYVDFPFGLVSPESDGAAGAVPKVRPTTVATNDPGRSEALEHVRKVVCVPCYFSAFARVYPDAALPVLSQGVIGDGAPPAVVPDVDGEFIAGPKLVGSEV